MIKHIPRVKMWIQRSLNYISIANASMILFLFLSELNKNYGFNIDIKLFFFPIIISTIIGFVVVGYLDERYMLKMEQYEISKRNPVFTDIQERLKRIEDKLK